MKKILCLVISLIVLLSSVSSFAEEFIIHSGVMFGMTREEVIALETDAGFKVIESEEYITVRGKIASIDESAIRYYFDENALTTAWYRLGGNHSSIGNSPYDPDSFDVVEDALVNKYGEPNFDTQVLDSIAFEYDIDGLIENLTNGLYSNYDVAGLSNWLFPVDEDTYLLIDHHLFSGKVKGAGFSVGYHTLCYQMMDATEVEAVIQGIIDEVQEDSQQLEDDI